MSKFEDLNNYLFTALERLNNADLKGEKLDAEIKRAQAVGNVAGQIIGAAALQLKANSMKEAVPMLEYDTKPKELRGPNYYKGGNQ